MIISQYLLPKYQSMNVVAILWFPSIERSIHDENNMVEHPLEEPYEEPYDI
jgi:hypothetical protein